MYTALIKENLAALGMTANPHHVEAWMRLECGTLDWLDPDRFRCEVTIAVQCISLATPEQTEELARSMGCAPWQRKFLKRPAAGQARSMGRAPRGHGERRDG